MRRRERVRRIVQPSMWFNVIVGPLWAVSREDISRMARRTLSVAPIGRNHETRLDFWTPSHQFASAFWHEVGSRFGKRIVPFCLVYKHGLSLREVSLETGQDRIYTSRFNATTLHYYYTSRKCYNKRLRRCPSSRSGGSTNSRVRHPLPRPTYRFPPSLRQKSTRKLV